MKPSTKMVIVILVILLLAVMLSAACGGGNDETEKPTPILTPSITSTSTPTATHEPSPTTKPTEDAAKSVVITIGNLTDLTGIAANAMAPITMALEDTIDYYNENNLIPGVELVVITYDGQTNPDRDTPGYELLRENGADLIFTPVPATPVSLKPRVDSDEVVLFALSANIDELLPPGYVFNLGVIPQYDSYTLLKWIAENDWDYQTKGPAKVGGAAWEESYSGEFLAGLEDYCSAHPDQFEWEGGYLTHFSMNWQAEVEALKDCDYVYPGFVMKSFVEQYRSAGYTEAKFIGSDTQTALMGMVDEAELWEEIDGMLFLRFSRWWNEEGEMVNRAKQLLYEYHPNDAETIIRSGNGYLATTMVYAILSIIADAAEAVGPQNLDSQAIYDAATSFVLTSDGVHRLSFGEEKRDATDSYAMYEARAAEEDIFRLQDEWYPTVRNP
ncbi:MAG: ABC transporter substrate-binding protein [Chloroflexi bacterium]|nr:ABC transporter substrate-binding protein [Chloroflexota bacterium]